MISRNDFAPESIPADPGCYLWKDDKEKVLYVGKARSLRKRVVSYLRPGQDPKTTALMEHATGVDFIATKSEVEALILENNLIKQHQPKYNIHLKDAKRYAYIALTNEAFPRVVLARKRNGKDRYFGPFVSAETRDRVLNAIRRNFQIRTCKRMPKRACLRYHLGLCPAPCEKRITAEEYNDLVRSAELVLRGKTKDLVKRLEKQMKNASGALHYEHALSLRNQIRAVEWLEEKQTMERSKKAEEDILNFIVEDNHVHLMLFSVSKGILHNKQEFEFAWTDTFLEEFIVQYYGSHPVPKELIIPAKIDESIGKYLEAIRETRVRLNVPKSGDKKQLLLLAKRNLELALFGQIEKLDDLKDNLRLQTNPEVIECFDISHLSGTSTVGSMVQFRFGEPDTSNYRRFRIRTVEGIDDTAGIAEVVKRRYRRLQSENADMPDLIIIDGGKGQLGAAMNELQELGIRIPTIAIAKKFEEVHVPGLVRPLRLDKRGKALQLIRRIRDEAHRFAINYNRLLRKKEMTS